MFKMFPMRPLGLITKKQQQLVKKLANISYPALLQQLIKISKQNYYIKNIEAQQQNQNVRIQIFYQCLLHFSAQFQSKNLFILSNDIKRVLKGKNQTNQLIDKWQIVTQKGLNEMFFKDQLKEYNQQSNKQIQQFFAIFNNTLQIGDRPTSWENSFLTEDLIAIYLFGVPSSYPFFQVSANTRHFLKQNYIQGLTQILHKFQTNQSFYCPFLRQKSFGKIFPPQLFNLSDQPFINDFCQKYFFSHLEQKYFSGSKKTFKQIGTNIAWLARFGFPFQQYIIKCLNFFIKHIRSRNKNQETKKVPNYNNRFYQDLNIAYSLFLIVRKILNWAPLTQTQSKINQLGRDYRIIYKIADSLKVFNMTGKARLSSLTEPLQDGNMQRCIQVIQQTLKGYCKELQKEEKLVSDKQQQLFASFEWQINQTNADSKHKTVQTIGKMKIIRYLMLCLYFNMMHFENQQNFQEAIMIHKIFNHKKIQSYLVSTLMIGDQLAQISIMEQAFFKIFQVKLFQQGSRILKTLKELRQKFSIVANKINSGTIENLESYHFGRSNNIQYVLSHNSRLPFYLPESFQSIISKNERQQQHKIIMCLLNDNQFVGKQKMKHLKNTIKQKIVRNPRLQILKGEAKYPALPDFIVKKYSGQTKQIYLKSTYCKSPRVDLKSPHICFDISNPQKMNKNVADIIKDGKK